MSILSSTSNYTNALSIYEALSQKSGSTSTTGNAASLLSDLTSTTSGTSSSVSPLLTSTGREEITKALTAMKLEGYTSFTFSDIEDYRQKLEADFAAAVKSDLAEMGVDEDIEFTLVLDASGNIQVISDHEDKAAVEAYFADNPEMVEVFEHIQALSNLKKSQQKAASLGNSLAKDLKISLQGEALNAFFDATESSTSDYFSQIANFGSGDTTSYLLGLKTTV
ncbi:MAG: hypothetical protein DELT_00371 [Desulfovibrio sp.]